jgi:glycosyltransferase involved in cell wall biosynthesis
VIPCYNGERTLAQAIDSALAQTYAEVEVIVVDDGSTDGSADVARRYGSRVVLVQQTNHGLSASRNAGITASKGEYITLLDADDVLLPECLERRIAVLDSDRTVGLVAGYYREIDSEGLAIERVPELRKVWEGQAFRQAVRRNWGPPVGWTFPADVFKRVGGFDPLLRSAEDWDFVIRVSLRYRVAYDSEPHVLYRKSAGQMSSNWIVMLDMVRAVQRKNRTYAPNPFHYWIDTAFGRFENGRRILFACLFEAKGGRWTTLARLCIRHPFLLWVGPLSALSFLTGKRPSNKPDSAGSSLGKAVDA